MYGFINYLLCTHVLTIQGLNTFIRVGEGGGAELCVLPWEFQPFKLNTAHYTHAPPLGISLNDLTPPPPPPPGHKHMYTAVPVLLSPWQAGVPSPPFPASPEPPLPLPPPGDRVPLSHPALPATPHSAAPLGLQVRETSRQQKHNKSVLNSLCHS